MKGGDPSRLGDELAAFLREKGLEEEVEAQSVVEEWEELVGERIAGVAQAVAAARGVLFVEVRSSAWLAELSLMRRDLMARLNAGRRKGRIERIVFRLSEGEDDGPGGSGRAG